MRGQRRAGGPSGSPARTRWERVRVVTEDAVYIGRLRLGSSRHGLRGALSDGRVYVTLSDVTSPGSATVEECIALHKGSIRSVVSLDGGEPPVPRRADGGE
jgi:hypothetical protein